MGKYSHTSVNELEKIEAAYRVSVVGLVEAAASSRARAAEVFLQEGG